MSNTTNLAALAATTDKHMDTLNSFAREDEGFRCNKGQAVALATALTAALAELTAARAEIARLTTESK